MVSQGWFWLPPQTEATPEVKKGTIQRLNRHTRGYARCVFFSGDSFGLGVGEAILEFAWKRGTRCLPRSEPALGV